MSDISDAGIAQKLIEVEEYIGQLERERDEARATKDLHKERQQELETALTAAERERDEALAEVQRLEQERAAQQLPEIGPVTPDEDGTSVWIDGERYYLGRMTAANYRLHAARNLALAAHVEARDAEAADTSSDDEVEQVIADGVSELREHDWSSEELIERVLRRVAHRACGGQEADRG